MSIVNPLDLDNLYLHRGAHIDGRMCTMEAVAYVAGEEWTDHPKCASQVISTFIRLWNDGLNDNDRQALKRYIPRLVRSVGTPSQEDVRAWMALDWLIRDYTPVWLRLAGLDGQADTLTGLPEFRAGMDVATIRPVIDAVRKDAVAAGDIAADAAGVAAEDADWIAARAAARAAATAAARAAATAAARAAATAPATAPATAAAWGAARAAAWGAAGVATACAAWCAWPTAEGAATAPARDAARDALAPAITQCQQSAHRLIDRMLQITES